MVSPFLFFFPCFHMIQSELAFLPVCSSLQTFHILRNLSCTEKHFRCTSVVASSDLLSQYCGDFGYYFFFFFLYFLILSLPLPSHFFSSFIYPVFHISFLYSIQAPGQMFHWRTPRSPLCFYKPVGLHSWRLLIPDDLAAVATEITDPSHGNTSFFDHSQTQQGSWFFKAGHTGNSW